MGGSPTQTEPRYETATMMRNDIMQKITNPDGSVEIRGGDLPYAGDKYPMVVPSNYKEPLRNMEYIKKEQASPIISGSPTQPERYNTARMMDTMKQETYPMLKQEKVTILDPAQQEADTYARLEKQGMSDDIDQEIIGAGKELYGMAKNKITSAINPNAYGRDTSRPASQTEESSKVINNGLK